MRNAVERLTAVHVAVADGASSSGKEPSASWVQRLIGLTCLTQAVDDLIRALLGGDQMLGGELFLAGDDRKARHVNMDDGSAGSSPRTCPAGRG